MNSRQLRYIKIIAETGSIQEASRLLSRNPSTLTRTLKAAEQEFEAPVFEKQEGKLKLTPEGDVVLEYIYEMLGKMDEMNRWISEERKKLNISNDSYQAIEWTDQEVRYLMEIRREGNLTSAARRMFISQPSLSQKVDEVEKRIGIPIFIRRKTGMEETAFGNELLNTMSTIQKRDNQLRRTLSEFAGMRRGESKNSVAFGFLPQMGANFLPVVLPEFMARYPGVRISFTEHDDRHLISMLKSGRLDFCILAFCQDAPEGWMMFEDFFIDTMYLIVPENMQEQFTFKKGQVLGRDELRQLDGMPFIMPEIGNELMGMTNHILQMSEADVNIRFTTRHMETARRLASAGAGVTIMPLSCLAWNSSFEHANYYRLSEEFGAWWALQTVYSKERGLSLGAREVLRLLHEGMENLW